LLLRILLIALLSLECIFSYTHSLETRDSSKMWQSISKQWPESGQAQMAYVESVLNQGSNKIKKDTLILLMQGLLEKEPEKVEIRKILARTLRDAGQPNNALREFRRILRDGTDDVVFLNEAADFLEYRGLEFEARKIRERAERLGEVLSQNTNPAS
jgi:Flp pilus assembly protein TadD